MIASTISPALPEMLILMPFVAQLLAIALMPFLAPRWWGKNYPRVSVGLGSITILYYLLVLHDPARLLQSLHEYASFVILLASLFIVTGGIHIALKGGSTPFHNVLFLMGGAILSNLIGTTGASVLLVRPWISMNRIRLTGFHTVFFIFLISNIGGALTPIGDPPLFLGFLKGVPFWWTLRHLFQPWLFTASVLLLIFYAFDRQNFLKAPLEVRLKEIPVKSWKINGLINVIPLGLILGSIFLPSPWRELLMISATFLAWILTPPSIRRKNEFSFEPIKEVAWLFLGIFATMIPALDYLEHHTETVASSISMGPSQFYYFTGLLSSVLDNAPTYLTFLSIEMGLQGGDLGSRADVLHVAMNDPRQLVAISMGAVFFGAMTYIGNGPNFMVRSIITEAGFRTPGFLSYIFLYALPILLPVLALAGWLFIR
jgi:Na+/H+ antiporter NhaD/arsenite permease-like protein